MAATPVSLHEMRCCAQGYQALHLPTECWLETGARTLPEGPEARATYWMPCGANWELHADQRLQWVIFGSSHAAETSSQAK